MPIDKSKEHKKRMATLRMVADQLSRRFISPIYLVGSYAVNHKTANDVDILMVVTVKRFFRLFRASEYSGRQFLFQKKQKLYIEEYVDDVDIDFKVVTLEDFTKHNGKKIKLDKIVAFPE